MAEKVTAMTIEHRGSRWYVKSESGKPLGDYATEAEANERLRQVEAAKAAKGMQRSVTMDVRGADGRVKTGVWDFTCLEGWDLKDGQYTEFTSETLGQMVANFEARGDKLPYDWNHQSGYTQQNGMPAPALAFAGALAVVWDGQIVKFATARGCDSIAPPDASGLGNGLYTHRTEVTQGTAEYPLGEQLLPGFQYLSPMFTSGGTDRQGEDTGYNLIAIAATNTPWQPGTTLMTLMTTAGAARTENPKEGKMAKLIKLAAKLSQYSKFDSESDDETKKAFASKMDADASAAALEEGFDYAGSAASLEEMAKLYEDSEMGAEPDGDEPPHLQARKLAAGFRRLAKMADAAKAPAAMSADPKEKASPEKDDAAMTAMQAVIDGQAKKLARLEAAETAREKAAEADRTKKFEQLADAAVRGGYPKEEREALVKFARSDYDAAHKAVKHLLIKSGAPASLFDNLTSQGAPIGQEAEARKVTAGHKTVNSKMGRFTEDDTEFAAEIRRLAESEDQTERRKVDSNLSAKERPVLFNRLLSAERVVRAEQPELAKTEFHQ